MTPENEKPPSAYLRDVSRSSQLLAIQQALDIDHLLRLAIEIQQIPAPTFAEHERAQFVADRVMKFGLENVVLDDLANVYGCWPGTDPERPALMVSAHTDTVFPPDTDLSVKRTPGRIYGPGIGDNSLGVASILVLLELLATLDVHLEADIWFVANSREEGLGNLDGMRAVWQALSGKLGAGIVVEGMALGRIYHAGIAVRRLRISCQTPGGHSWLHFGQPNAIRSSPSSRHPLRAPRTISG